MKKDQILLARRYNTGYEDGNFSVPAGHVEEGESCMAAMIREAKEEIDIAIKPESLSLAHVMHRKTNRESIDFFFIVRKWEGTPKINEADKCDLIEWCSVDSLPTNTIGYIKQAIDYTRRKESYSELGF